MDILKAAGDILRSLGFKKKSNYWFNDSDELQRFIYFQRSRFSPLYYLEYGFIIKSLDLDGLTPHYSERVREQQDVLDLESSLTDEERELKLSDLLRNEVVPNLLAISTEQDLRIKVISAIAKDEANLISLRVKEYFQITDA